MKHYLLNNITTQRNFVITRGDSRIAITIARNADTAKLDRENRFLIDDPDSPHKLAYLLTKPLKVGLSYNSEGVYKFVLQEVTGTINDNQELGIADYYKHFSRGEQQPIPDYGDPGIGDNPEAPDERRIWL